MQSMTLALKAEVVFAIFVTLRHRTVRLVLAFAAAIVALRVMGAGGSHHSTILLVAGSVGAVAASRVLARGAALEALRRTAAPWWLPPSGRLAGVGLLIAAVVGAAALVLGGGTADVGRAWAIGVVYALAWSAVTAALAPVAGATGAGTLGLIGAWVGSVPPSGIAAALGKWPYLAGPAVTLWNMLPLEWRAARWLRTDGAGDLIVLALWTPAAIALAAWTAARAYRSETAPTRET